MNKDISGILCDEAELDSIVKRLAEEINRDYAGKSVVVVGILKGSAIFLADLFRRLEIDCTLDFMAVSSYGSATIPSGSLRIEKNLSTDISGKHVLIVEDILDTGNTLYALKAYLEELHPCSVRLCTLLDKPSRREKPITADYCGREVENQFIVGYGLDYDEHYRNLPYIGILSPSVYRK